MTKTPTLEAKEIIINLLSSKPGTEITIAEIKEELSQKATMTITEGTTSGALYALTKDTNNGVVNISRGVYSWDPEAIKNDLDLTHKFYDGVLQSKEKLEGVVKSIDVLTLDEKDIPLLKKMKKLISDLDKFNEELLEVYGKKINE